MSGKKKTRSAHTKSSHAAKVQWKRRLMMAFASIVIQLVKTSWAETSESLEDLQSTTTSAAEAGNKSMSKSLIKRA